MKKLATRAIPIIMLLWLLPQSVQASRLLVPMGQLIGLELEDETVTVAAFDEALGAASREAGLQVGDRIVSIDGQQIRSVADVRQALAASDGDVDASVLRGGKAKLLRLNPQITTDGPKLGVYLKQGVTGVGTVTWYDPESGRFGALGHGVNDPQGNLVRMQCGKAYEADILSVKAGRTGAPGQLLGVLHGEKQLGTLTGNTPQGVFGNIALPCRAEPLPVGDAEEIRTGSATILSTVCGEEPQEYSVEILKIYPNARAAGRNLLLRVTDPALLEQTGGIVQGMSGSPIIQDGKLVGAVTHVLVNDPTTGYGIFIENMLDAAA